MGCPEAGVGLRIGKARSQGGWLRVPRCPRVGVDLLVGGARAKRVQGLVLACWYVGWVLTSQAVDLWCSWGWCLPTGCETGPRVSASSLVDGARSWGS